MHLPRSTVFPFNKTQVFGQFLNPANKCSALPFRRVTSFIPYTIWMFLKSFCLRIYKKLRKKVFLGWLNVKHMHVVFEVDIKELYPAYCFAYHPFKAVNSQMSEELDLYITVVQTVCPECILIGYSSSNPKSTLKIPCSLPSSCVIRF